MEVRNNIEHGGEVQHMIESNPLPCVGRWSGIFDARCRMHALDFDSQSTRCTIDQI